MSTVYTDAAGHYNITPDLTGLSSAYTNRNGSVALEVDVTDAAGVSTEFPFSAATPGTDSVNDPLIAVAGTQNETASFDLHTAQTTSALGAAATPTVRAASVTPALSSASAHPDDNPPLPGNPRCDGEWHKIDYFSARSEHFMELYDFGHVEVTEQTGSSAMLGVAFGIDSKGWKAGASVEYDDSNGSAADIPYGLSRHLFNKMNMRTFGQPCSDGHTRTELRFSSYNNMQDHVTKVWHEYPFHTDDGRYCTRHNRGTFTKNTGKNLVISGGIDAPFGLSLDAQQAYESQVVVAWTAPAAGEMICGSNTSGFNTSVLGGGAKVPSSAPCSSAVGDVVKPTVTAC